MGLGQINGVLKIYEINSERQSTSKINSFFQGQTLEVGYLRYLKILDSRGGMEGGLFQEVINLRNLWYGLYDMYLFIRCKLPSKYKYL